MKTVCSPTMCNACMACQDKCPKSAVRVVDLIQYSSAVIDESLCVNCGLCEKVCPNHTKPQKKEPRSWKQGWALNEKIRASSSSGGIAAEITRAFIQKGGTVCSCVFQNGAFVFRSENRLEAAEKFAGSKYVKSDATGIYREIESLLKTGESVLFIGLPCQSASLQNFIPDALKEKLYCIDLICHGTPSPLLLEKHAKERGVVLSQCENVSFRDKSKFNLQLISRPGKKENEAYMLTFLRGDTYTSNCYECQFASAQRVSDLTIGDSWGSNLADELDKGCSLILCMTAKGQSLLDISELHLESVDIEKAKAANHQLVSPAPKSKRHNRFFCIYSITNSFRIAAFAAEPRIMIKKLLLQTTAGQWVKKIVKSAGIRKG